MLADRENAKRLALYHRRLSDRQIAKRCGITKKSVAEWRRCRRLPPNFCSAGHKLTTNVLRLANGMGWRLER